MYAACSLDMSKQVWHHALHPCESVDREVVVKQVETSTSAKVLFVFFFVFCYLMRKTWYWIERPTKNMTDVQAETLKSLEKDMDVRELISTPLHFFLHGLRVIAVDNKDVLDRVVKP